MIYLGIDPGLSGALAALFPEGRVELFDVPTLKATKGQLFLAPGMADLLRPFRGGPAFAVVERAEAPRLGAGKGAVGNVTSGLKIGYGMGLWVGILAALQIPYETVVPRAWKQSFGLPAGDKKASRARAQELFPQIGAELGKRRPDFSEALLIAEWARRRNGGDHASR